MKRKIMAFLLAAVIAVPSNITAICAKEVDGNFSSETEDVSAMESKEADSADGIYGIEYSYIPAEKISLAKNVISSEEFTETITQEGKHSVKQRTVPFNGMENNENDLLNDSSADYGFMQLDIFDNAYGMKMFYVRMLEIFTEMYQSDQDIAVSDFGGEELFCIGSVEYASLGLTPEEIFKVYVSVLNDHPMFYFVDNMYMYDSSKAYFMASEEFVEGGIRQGFQEKLEKTLKDFESKAAGLKSNYEIVSMVHNKIISEIEYAYLGDGITPKNNVYVHSVIGYVSEEKEAVCDGYSKIFAAVLNYLDIENIFVTGWAVEQGGTTSSADAHAWNMVRLGNGNYYFVDCTWDDTEYEEFQTEYLCIGRDFYHDHSILQNGGSVDEDYLYPLPEVPEEDYSGEDTLVLKEDPKYEVKQEEEEKNDFEVEDGILTGYHGEGGDVVIPEGITGIGDYVFSGCADLVSVSIPSTVESIGQGAFYHCVNLEKFIVSEENKAFVSVEGVLYTKDRKKLVQYPAAKKEALFQVVSIFADNIIGTDVKAARETQDQSVSRETEYKVLKETETIGYGAFSNAENLEKITLPDGLKTIEGLAFESCTGLVSMEIPSETESIGEQAFYGCSSLAAVAIPDNVTIYDSENVFSGTSDDFTIYCYEDSAMNDYAEKYGYKVSVVDAGDDVGEAMQEALEKGKVTAGDVNSDGQVNSEDALTILKIAAELLTPSEEQEQAADVNGDGRINSEDALLVLKHAAGLVTKI